ARCGGGRAAEGSSGEGASFRIGAQPGQRHILAQSKPDSGDGTCGNDEGDSSVDSSECTAQANSIRGFPIFYRFFFHSGFASLDNVDSRHLDRPDSSRFTFPETSLPEAPTNPNSLTP